MAHAVADENGVAVGGDGDEGPTEPPPYQGQWRGGGGFEHNGVIYRSCLDIFAELGRRCMVVLCCRVSPRQKAEVVAMGKKQFGKITLAIGDGANDVPMIKEAHIGIGISGHEGMQATLASDYAIGQFKFLKHLLLVHGRFSYKRVARLVMYFFYKNTLYAMTATWLCRHNGYSGMSFFDGMIGSAYQIVLTSLPVFVIALFDRDFVDKDTVLDNPELYFFSQQGIHLSINNFIRCAPCMHSSKAYAKRGVPKPTHARASQLGCRRAVELAGDFLSRDLCHVDARPLR
jgi:hypothetical protein